MPPTSDSMTPRRHIDAILRMSELLAPIAPILNPPLVGGDASILPEMARLYAEKLSHIDQEYRA